MPFVTITLRQGTPPEFRKAVSDAVLQAQVDVLGIPADDRFHFVHELAPENLLQEPVYFGIPRGPGAVFVQLQHNGRTPARKQALFEAIAANLERGPGVRREDVFINLVEPAPENWWIAGREVDPMTGYDVRMDPTARPKPDDRRADVRG